MISTYASVARRDPTRTAGLRTRFAVDTKRRFALIQRLIVKAIVDEDCFALAPSPFQRVTTQVATSTPGFRAFNFATSSEKIRAFMRWLGRQEDAAILGTTHALQLGEGIEDAWTNTYITSSYQQGIARARKELEGSRPNIVSELTPRSGISAAFNAPMHADRVGMLFTRVYTDLQGITAQMDRQLSTILSRGLVNGLNPRTIAREMTKTMTGPLNLSITDTLGRFIPAARRAETLARTEVIRAHHVGMIQEYRNWGVAGVRVKAEWKTAGDDRVCDDCANLEGQIYSLDEIEGMIPLHPMCRCIALPVDMTEEVGNNMRYLTTNLHYILHNLNVLKRAA